VNADAVLRSNELRRGNIELVAGPFNIVKEMKYKGNKLEAGDPVPKGAIIDLVVMDGGSGADFKADSFLDSSLEDAKFVIFGQNLNLGDVHLVGDTTGGAVVLKQKPAPNENIKVGDAVELWIGKPGTEVPDDDDPEN
jgi:beta-lactam-binding protein with PASTA domain